MVAHTLKKAPLSPLPKLWMAYCGMFAQFIVALIVMMMWHPLSAVLIILVCTCFTACVLGDAIDALAADKAVEEQSMK